MAVYLVPNQKMRVRFPLAALMIGGVMPDDKETVQRATQLLDMLRDCVDRLSHAELKLGGVETSLIGLNRTVGSKVEVEVKCA